MPGHRSLIILSPLALLVAVVLLPSSNAAAQRGLDRALTTSRVVKADPETTVSEPQDNFLVPEAPPDSVVKASWLVQPLGTVSGSDNDVGLLAGYRNENRHGSWEWQLTARGLRRYRSGRTHARWQADGEIYPPLHSLTKLPVILMIAATHAHTIDVGRSDVIAAEIDVEVPNHRAMTLTLGVIGYYGWESPAAGESSHGTILGLIGYWQKGRFDLVPEYDFSSDFAGGDSYSVAGSYRISGDSSKTVLRMRGGWEKGGTVSLRFELGVPNNKVVPRKLSRL